MPHRKHKQTAAAHAQPPLRKSAWRGWMLASLTALVVARPLLPSEAVSWLGDGQPFNMLWLLLACGVCLLAWKSGERLPRIRPIDVAVAALIVWHSLSALVAIERSSPRPALNMLWEWIALGVCYFLTRVLARAEHQMRGLAAVMVSLAVVLSSFGYHQYFVSLPQERAEYARDADAMLRLSGEWYPPGSVERKQFDSRVESREPIATFALANSLGGFLATWLIVCLGRAISSSNSGDQDFSGATRAAVWPWLICAAVIAGCLLLTKSRSAYVAIVAGGFGLAWIYRGPRKWLNPKILLVGGLGVVLLIGLAIAAGGLDRLVLAEAGKSLAYRLEYWQSTLAMIADYPWLGCGPGNFQDYYTAYKLPWASEEIRDPHNFIFEVWATAGTPALIALAAVLVLFTRLVVQNPAAPAVEKSSTLEALQGASAPIVAGAGAGLVLAYVIGLLLEIHFSPEKLAAALAIGAIALVVLLPSALNGPWNRRLPAIAVLVLLIHLLAAGGIGYPGIAQSLWVLIAFGANLSELSGNEARSGNIAATRPTRVGSWAMPTAAIIFGGLAAGCFWTGYTPVLRSHALILQAESLREQSDDAGGEAALLAAAAADPFAAEPWRRLAQMRLAEWIADRSSTSRRGFEASEAPALELRPQSSAAQREAGRWRLSLFEADQDPADAQAASEHYQRAVELYPNSAPARADLALALKAGGQQALAREQAAAALRLDEMNPHQDKKLAEKTVRGLRAIAAPDR